MNKAGKLIRLLSITSYRQALRLYHVAAGIEHESVLHRLDCRTVADVGANCGQFAIVARRCFPQAQIISFEPLPIPAAKFRAVFADDTRVTLHEVAIGPFLGHAAIHVSKRDDSSSLLPIKSTQVAIFPGTEEIATVNVRVTSLRELVSAEDIRPPALLKLDVQGFELEALRGCEDLLDYFRYIIVECSFVELYAGQALAGDVVEWLRDRRFQLFAVYNTVFGRDKQKVQADFLFGR